LFSLKSETTGGQDGGSECDHVRNKTLLGIEPKNVAGRRRDTNQR
jgi:hypothetical protein